MGKLTASQLRILKILANNRGAAPTIYVLGRGTCEALRKRGLIRTHDDRNRPFDTYSNPFVMITDAGRAALSNGETSAEGKG